MQIDAQSQSQVKPPERDMIRIHPIEAAKHDPGEHSLGKAADIAISGERVIILLALAQKHGMTRFGIKQKGEGRFIHLGTGLPSEGFSSTTWSY